MIQESGRKAWVDYFKAIAIILVVVGHATGKFNGYIYQFHIAAFFWISGYLSSIDKKNFDELFIVRFFRLILPYFFYAVCGLLLFAVLQKFGVLHYISSFESIPAFSQNLRTIFSALYCDWLGATWFLTSLFIATCISKIALMLDKNQARILFLIVVLLLFNMGYYYVNNGVNPTPFQGLGHYCIIQFFFSLGFLCRKYCEKSMNNNKLAYLISILPLNILLFIVFKKNALAMDLASNSVNSPLKDMLLAGNGICFIFIISKLLEILHNKYLEKILFYIGKNTFGILIYHFFGFKIVTAVLCLIGKCDMSMISNLCPPAILSDKWWFLYVTVTIIFSLFMWHITTKFKVIRFLSGNDGEAYLRIYKKYEELVDEE